MVSISFSVIVFRSLNYALPSFLGLTPSSSTELLCDVGGSPCSAAVVVSLVLVCAYKCDVAGLLACLPTFRPVPFVFSMMRVSVIVLVVFFPYCLYDWCIAVLRVCGYWVSLGLRLCCMNERNVYNSCWLRFTLVCLFFFGFTVTLLFPILAVGLYIMSFLWLSPYLNVVV